MEVSRVRAVLPALYVPKRRAKKRRPCEEAEKERFEGSEEVGLLQSKMLC
jgi:hypothetical protein